MKAKFILLIISLTSCIIALFAQTNLPDKLEVYTPEYIKEPTNKWSKSESWQEYAVSRIRKNDFGKPNKIVWTAYSDRDANTTYSAPTSAETHSMLSFMEKVYIADVKNGYALIFSDEYAVNFPTINSTAKTKGWIPIENLLLWEKCPQNKNSIFQKGLVVGDPSRGQELVQNPPFKTTPSNVGADNGNARKLDILFVLKTTVVNNKTYYLVSKELSVKDRSFEVKGWLPEEYITLWDQRLCLEPTTASLNFDHYKSLGVFPAIYEKLDEAKRIYNTGSQGNPFWIYKEFSRERMGAYIMRAPILGNSFEDIYKVASIASIDAARGSTSETNIKELEIWKSVQRNINIIFVIDATSSMKNFYTPIANALENIMRLDWEGKKLNVGVVLYRNVADGNREIEVHEISNNIDAAINFISSNKDDVGSVGRIHSESLFKGLETALDYRRMRYDPKQSNFMIVIGDAGNQNNSQIDEIAQKMAQNRINLLAFQANHYGLKAYDDFATQIGIIIKKNIEYRGISDITYRLNANRLYVVQRENSEIPSLIYGGYKFANPGNSEPTNILRTNIISNVKEFNDLIQQKIEFLSGVEDAGLNTSNSIDEIRLREILKEFGWTEVRIDDYVRELKKSGVTKLIGFAPIKLTDTDNSLFDYVLFFSQDELKEIIKELNKLESNSNISNRKAYQDAIIAMGQALLGQMSTDEIMGMSMDQLTAQIYGVPVPISNCGVKIVDIIDRKKIADNQLQDYINDFNTKRRGLENIVNNPYNGKFTSNGITYIWIPFTNMPGYCAQ
jgi:hypothetical protein